MKPIYSSSKSSNFELGDMTYYYAIQDVLKRLNQSKVVLYRYVPKSQKIVCEARWVSQRASIHLKTTSEVLFQLLLFEKMFIQARNERIQEGKPLTDIQKEIDQMELDMTKKFEEKPISLEQSLSESFSPKGKPNAFMDRVMESFNAEEWGFLAKYKESDPNFKHPTFKQKDQTDLVEQFPTKIQMQIQSPAPLIKNEKNSVSDLNRRWIEIHNQLSEKFFPVLDCMYPLCDPTRLRLKNEEIFQIVFETERLLFSNRQPRIYDLLRLSQSVQILMTNGIN